MLIFSSFSTSKESKFYPWGSYLSSIPTIAPIVAMIAKATYGYYLSYSCKESNTKGEIKPANLAHTVHNEKLVLLMVVSYISAV